jgi:hypothetical protein
VRDPQNLRFYDKTYDNQAIGMIVMEKFDLNAKEIKSFCDTAVTWLARAGCTVPQIAAVTGHSETSVHSILNYHLARHPELADAAIARMTEWFDQYNPHNKALIAPK